MRQHWNIIILQHHKALKQTNKTKHDKYNIDNLAIHWEPRDQGWVVFIDVWAR